jgi:RNA polymerase sigma factor (sigma-70 family)
MAAPVQVADRDEHVLVARLLAGDDSALAEIYDRCASLVFGIARRVVADPVAAEDVCQEVFTQLWCHAGAVDLDRSTLRGWLSVLAHRRAVDWVRRSERSRRREERAEPTASDVVMPDLAELAADQDRARRARAAVAALPDDQRRAVELAFWGGRSYRQVADDLGIPEGTAKSRVRLALARLATVLREEAD